MSQHLTKPPPAQGVRAARRPDFRGKALLVGLLALITTSLGVVASTETAHAAQVISRNCNSGWVGWAEYIDYGDNIKMRLRPTKRAYLAMGFGLTTRQMWDAYFACIGWDDGFSRLSKSQWDSLWLQHRCHEYLGVIGRLKSGDTFDYESWVPFRGDLRTAFNNGCN